MKWEYIFNIDTISIGLVAIAVIYCLLTTKRNPGQFEFQGMGSKSGKWNISEGKKLWDYGVSRHHKKKESRRGRGKLNKHEERCREIFQRIYGRQFKSVRPKWLENPVTGKNLELDGYCPETRTPLGKGLAFEYDGVQHSKYNKHFHRGGPDEFIYQCKKDSWKNIRCKQEGVFLVRIPHFVAYGDLERYITNKLEKHKLMPRNYRRSGYFRPRSQEVEYNHALHQSRSMHHNNSTKFLQKAGKDKVFLSGLYG